MNCIKCSRDLPTGAVFCCWCGVEQSIPQKKKNPKRRGNGQGSVYKNGKVWQAEVTIAYTDSGKRIRRKKSGFKTKKEALEYIPILANNFNGQCSSGSSGKRTVEYYYESWKKSDSPSLSKSKQTAYRIAWKKMESIRYFPINALSVVLLRDLVADEAPTHYPARDMKTLLSKIITLAMADQLLTINMADFIPLPPKNESERQPWSDDELRVIWRAYDDGDVVAAYLLLMIYTGMMPGELDRCKKQMIHLDERKIIGAGIKTEVRKETPIVLAEIIVPVIERILTYTPDGDDQRILYTDRWSFYEAYHAFTSAQGIRDLPMYSCRHTTATALAVGTDVAPSIIQKIMRHAKFTTTQHYIHPDSSDALAGVNKLAR